MKGCVQGNFVIEKNKACDGIRTQTSSLGGQRLATRAPGKFGGISVHG